MNLYDTKPPVIHLKPGEMYITGKPTVVSTILGSCVAITMFNRSFGIGAICHGLLPQCKDSKSCDTTCTEELKYIGCSIQRMIERFDSLKIKHADIEVKLFGGSDMFESKENGKIITVGKQNIETAMSVIETKRLVLLAADVGGALGRKIFFYTHTGEVFLKRLEKTDGERIKE